ncbi:AAA family ATPase [uncultured Chryseobacterium sp.]|uniref:ATP-dependent nuclease n=1 Tax=uncultured Chryseobacterium sp. TaxID=259322 RepID=UPI0025D1626D|nr:AAA family ATPase [uncultured Chryseobacterium sp.]
MLSGQASSIIRNLILDTKTKAPRNFELLKKRLKEDFNFSIDNIDFEESRDLYVNAKYAESHENSKVVFDFNASGSGFMQILQILTPIYRYCPDESNIVLLDEPDAHLHPNLQASLAKTLREIQKELNIQIIISTHSTTIIRLAEPSEVIPISSFNQKNSPLAKVEDVENEISNKIDTYNLGKSVISGKLLFIEDQKTEILEAFEKISGKMIFNGARTIPVLKGRGKDDKIPFSIADVIGKFTEKNIEIFVIRDGDSINSKWREELTNYAQNKNVKLILLERHEIENYILDPSFILKVLNEKYPEQISISKDILEEKIKTFLTNTIQLNKYRFDDNLEDSIYKTAFAIGKSEYRNPLLSKSEAIAIRESYSEMNTYEDLIKFGMGKESLSQLLTFLSSEGFNISKKDLINAIDFIPEEIEKIFDQLVSLEEIKRPDSLPDLDDEIDDDDEDSEDVEISK